MFKSKRLAAPYLVWMVLFTVVPLFIVVYYALTDGAGRFTLNTLRIRDNLGADPIAERLLRNMLRYASTNTPQPITPLPADFGQQLDAMDFK